MDPQPFEYLTRAPDSRLGRYVESIWYARGTLRVDSERVAPTGSTVLGIVLGAPIVQTVDNGSGGPHLADTGFLIGPHDHPIVNRPTGETWCVGIVTTPIGCRAALGVHRSRCAAGSSALSHGRRSSRSAGAWAG